MFPIFDLSCGILLFVGIHHHGFISMNGILCYIYEQSQLLLLYIKISHVRSPYTLPILRLSGVLYKVFAVVSTMRLCIYSSKKTTFRRIRYCVKTKQEFVVSSIPFSLSQFHSNFGNSRIEWITKVLQNVVSYNFVCLKLKTMGAFNAISFMVLMNIIEIILHTTDCDISVKGNRFLLSTFREESLRKPFKGRNKELLS